MACIWVPSILGFNATIKGIVFPKLRIMKLGIMQDFIKFLGFSFPLGDTESAFKGLLESIHLQVPALETLVIAIVNARDYLPTESAMDGLDWDTPGEAMSQLAHPIDGGITSKHPEDVIITQARSSRFSKVVVAAWFEDWSGPKGDSLIAYVKKKLHRCTSVGLEVDFEILYETDWINQTIT